MNSLIFIIKFIADVIGEDANANNILANCEDVSGKLTFNIGKIDLTRLPYDLKGKSHGETKNAFRTVEI